MRHMIGCLLALLAGCSTLEVPLPSSPDGGPIDPPELGPAWGKPVSGGTLAISKTGDLALVSDPDRDRLVSVDLVTHKVIHEILLAEGEEPGRVIEDGAGRFHVALRAGGDLLTLASGRATDVTRRHVCNEPRGLAWQASTDLVHVACRGGELVSLPAAGGAATRTLRLDRDLRDVVVVGSSLMVTRLKTSEVLTIDASGTVIQRDRSPQVRRNAFLPDTGELLDVASESAVAWRAVALPDGSGMVVSHQRARLAPLGIDPGGYGGDPCGGGPLESTATLFTPGAQPIASRPLSITTLPVDIAISPDGQRMAFAMAGDETVRIVGTRMLSDGDKPPCEDPPEENIVFDSQGMPTSVAFTPAGDLVVFYPDHNYLTVYAIPYTGVARWSLILPGERGYDMGRALFHDQTSNGIACASCHPEASEDGRVWEFRNIGPRRTQYVGGFILQRAPYHWDGDMTDLTRLMNEVFVGRMGGSLQGSWEVQALANWLDTVPPAAPGEPADFDAVARGQALFESAAVGCAGCHAGAVMTNNLRFDVGTGGTFKVPSLVGIGARAPFLHNGCAATLRDRFTCGGGDTHGVTSTLAPEQLDDLVAYLETL